MNRNAIVGCVACAAVGVLWALCGPGITTMPTQLLAGLPLLLVGLMEAGGGSYVKAQVRGKRIGLGPGLTPPVFVALLGRLAGATAFTAVAFLGFWGSLAIYSSLHKSQLLVAERNLPAHLVGVAGSVALLAGALWLRRCCRAPGDDSDGTRGGAAGDPGR